LVQKISSPTNSILLPSATVKLRQPSQSFSPMPSSRSTIGYCFAHDSQILISSSEVIAFLLDLKSTYFPSSHISLAAGSRQIEISVDGLYPAFAMASRMSSTASSLDFKSGANPPSSPTAVLYP